MSIVLLWLTLATTGKLKAAQALAKIAITTNPRLVLLCHQHPGGLTFTMCSTAFPGQRALEVVKPCISLLTYATIDSLGSMLACSTPCLLAGTRISCCSLKVPWHLPTWRRSAMRFGSRSSASRVSAGKLELSYNDGCPIGRLRLPDQPFPLKWGVGVEG